MATRDPLAADPAPKSSLETAKESGPTGAWDALKDYQRYLPEAQLQRAAFDRNAYRNLLFYMGMQWIRYESNTRQWQPLRLPDWFPKNQTNKFAVSCDGMKAVLAQSKPNTIYGPGGDSEADIAASKACDTISAHIDTEVDNERLRDEAAAWIAITGNAFVNDGYDMSEEHGTKFVQSYSCLTCAQNFQPHEIREGCPGCGGAQFMRATDANGKPDGEKYPIGRMSSTVEGPFGILFDMQARHFDNSLYTIHVKTFPTEQLKTMYPSLAEKIKPGVEEGNTGVYYQRAIAYMTGNTGAGTLSLPSGTGGGGARGDYTTLARMWVKPRKDLPYGGQALIANDQVLWKGEIDSRDDQGRPFVPFTHMGFKKVPGRVLYKTPADDLISKQIQRNKLEALLQLGAERVSNPTWLIPSGIGIENITGEPGEKLIYNGLLNGLKPERTNGADMPASLYRWLGIVDQDFQDLAATYDIMLGKTPEGVSTLGGMQILRDRGLARFQDVLMSWGSGWTEIRRKRLFIFKQRVRDERLMMVLGENSKWEAKKFLGATISGNISVRLDEASLMPKSKTYQQMIAGQMLQANLIDMQDPIQRHEFFAIMDAQQLATGLDADIKDAIQEREEFLDSGGVRPREIVDNHEVHLAQHVRDAKSDAFFEKWSPDAQGAWLQHIEWHFNVLMQRAQQAREQDPSFARAQVDTKAFADKKSIENKALEDKKGIELEAKGLTAEMKLAQQHHDHEHAKTMAAIERHAAAHRAAQPDVAGA